MKNSVLVCALLTIFSSVLVFGFSTFANAQIPLVGNKVATLIDVDGNPARAIDLVKAALQEEDISIVATTQAWSGSGLRNGKFVGYIDHYSLNDYRGDYLFSQPYATIPLHIASTNPKAQSLTRLDKIYRERLGIENRFANTDQLRAERSVKWARSPDFFGNIQQLAGRRVEYIMADKYMLSEFNKMLLKVDEEPLYISDKTIYEVTLQLAIKSNQANAQGIIDKFNARIKEMRDNGTHSSIYEPALDKTTLLDETLYEDIVRRW